MRLKSLCVGFLAGLLGFGAMSCASGPDLPKKEMPAGAVISAEPGLYLEGRFGVRIEDVIILREDGCENITKAPKELIIL